MMTDVKNTTTQQSLTSGPSWAEDVIANRGRENSIPGWNKQSFSQRFRRVVSPSSEAVIQTNGVILNTLNLNILKTGYSELTILTFSSKDGVPGAISAGAPEKKPDPKQGAAMRSVSKVMKVNKIISVIRAPVDQTMRMEVFFGNDKWVDNYYSNFRYQFRTQGAAEFAMIKLYNGNVINSAYFNMDVNIEIVPDEASIIADDDFSLKVNDGAGSVRNFPRDHSSR